MHKSGRFALVDCLTGVQKWPEDSGKRSRLLLIDMSCLHSPSILFLTTAMTIAAHHQDDQRDVQPCKEGLRPLEVKGLSH